LAGPVCLAFLGAAVRAEDGLRADPLADRACEVVRATSGVRSFSDTRDL